MGSAVSIPDGVLLHSNTYPGWVALTYAFTLCCTKKSPYPDDYRLRRSNILIILINILIKRKAKTRRRLEKKDHISQPIQNMQEFFGGKGAFLTSSYIDQ